MNWGRAPTTESTFRVIRRPIDSRAHREYPHPRPEADHPPDEEAERLPALHHGLEHLQHLGLQDAAAGFHALKERIAELSGAFLAQPHFLGSDEAELVRARTDFLRQNAAHS